MSDSATRNKTCAVVSCTQDAVKNMDFCPQCWNKIPQEMILEMWVSKNLFELKGSSGSEEYRVAVAAAANYVEIQKLPGSELPPHPL